MAAFGVASCTHAFIKGNCSNEIKITLIHSDGSVYFDNTVSFEKMENHALRSEFLGGTGLGLSIVKHAAKYHNATILVTSEEGYGSTFTVVFEG